MIHAAVAAILITATVLCAASIAPHVAALAHGRPAHHHRHHHRIANPELSIGAPRSIHVRP